MPFLPFVYGYSSSSPRAHCPPNKSVPTLRYTRRHGLVYTDPCPKALTECSPLDFRRSSIRRSPHTEGCLLWVRGQLSGTERRTRDLKVSDSSPSRIGGRIFFLRGQFSVLVPVSVAVPSHVTAVAHTRSRSLCQTQAG